MHLPLHHSLGQGFVILVRKQHSNTIMSNFCLFKLVKLVKYKLKRIKITFETCSLIKVSNLRTSQSVDVSEILSAPV